MRSSRTRSTTRRTPRTDTSDDRYPRATLPWAEWHAGPTGSEIVQLSPNTSIYQARQGYVLRTADEQHFELTLSESDIDELLEVLAGDATPHSPTVSAVLDALLDAGHVVSRPDPCHVCVRGNGKIAAATSQRLGRWAMSSSEGAEVICHLSDEAVDVASIGAVDLVSFRDGITQVITPRGVDAADVLDRRRATVLHRDRIEPRYRPVDGGRRVVSAVHPVSDRAADAIADLIVVELADRRCAAPGRSQYLLTAVDLRSLTVSRHPVLPVPVAPQ